MKARSFWPLAVGYVALRILLTVVIAALVVLLARLAGLDMPVLVAAMLAVIVQLPLAWLMLGGMRRRLTAQLAASAGERRRLRGELQAALSGERTSSEKQAAAGEQAASSEQATSSEQAMPDQAASSDQAMSEQAASSEQATSEQATSEQATSEQATSEQATSKQTASAEQAASEPEGSADPMPSDESVGPTPNQATRL